VSLQPDGRLGALGSVIKHTGSSINSSRQKSPHAHGVYLSPDNRFALIPDLGIDRVLSYAFDPAAAKLKPNSVLAGTSLKPGSGPRHLAFHPDGKFVYVINELLCTFAVMSYNVPTGTLTPVQTISTLPPGQGIPPGTSTAEIQVHPNGRFLYGSNRGANTLVVYAISPTTGQLTYVESISTLGKTPRHFALDPTGTWLLALLTPEDSIGAVAFLLPDAASTNTSVALTPGDSTLDLDVDFGLDRDRRDLLHHVSGRVQVDQALVDAHLVAVPGLGALAARRLARRDAQRLGGQAHGALDLALQGLLLRRALQLRAHLLQGNHVLTAQGDADL
jgi:DNA-binding beta-propeller fold protein YncE